MPPKDHPAPRPLNAEDLSGVSGGMTLFHDQTGVAAETMPPPIDTGNAPPAGEDAPLSDEDAPQVTNTTATPTGTDYNAVWRPGDGNLDFAAGKIYPGVGHFNSLTLDLTGLPAGSVLEALKEASAKMGLPGPPHPASPFSLEPNQIQTPYRQGSLVLFGETITFSGITRIQITGMDWSDR
ncbi:MULTISPECIES: hypothetical protein [Roseomonadaceae]|uniref:Uncharacterized protein n=1 Tax=Falsiroseomonas oleicola TaxID=2801474 RepID=A0ABS6H9X1_9PROT|nr:hypothetical protein [Roseomonas oleicola]MBU8545475.1 hypothetical protein [Roseomonas oleicola]